MLLNVQYLFHWKVELLHPACRICLCNHLLYETYIFILLIIFTLHTWYVLCVSVFVHCRLSPVYLLCYLENIQVFRLHLKQSVIAALLLQTFTLW